MILNFCAACGATRATATLVYHHVIPKIFGGSNSPKNLLTVCWDCHDKLHGKTTHMRGPRWRIHHTTLKRIGQAIAKERADWIAFGDSSNRTPPMREMAIVNALEKAGVPFGLGEMPPFRYKTPKQWREFILERRRLRLKVNKIAKHFSVAPKAVWRIKAIGRDGVVKYATAVVVREMARNPPSDLPGYVMRQLEETSERLRKSWLKREQRDQYRVIPGAGDPCRSCGEPMQIRKHKAITQWQLNHTCYYTRWFRCVNPDCDGTQKQVTPERYRIENEWYTAFCATYEAERDQYLRQRRRQWQPSKPRRSKI